jgi:hypothetical protein
VSGAKLFGEMNAVGEDEAALGVGVENFDGLARHSGLNVTGFLRATARHIFGRRNDADYFYFGLEGGERAHDPKHGGAASHVVLHFFHAVSGLDGDAASIEGDGFADEADYGSGGIEFGGNVSENHDARRFDAALRDAEQRSHFEVGDALFVKDFHGEACFASHDLGFFGEDARSEFIGRLVDEIAGEILSVGDGVAASEAFFGGGKFGGGETEKLDGVDGLVVLLIGFVFVGFEGCGTEAFGNYLSQIFGDD